MKFRNLVFVFLVVVILLAWFTKPDYDDFVSYQDQQVSNLNSPPVIEYSDALLFSQVKVTYYQQVDAKASGTPVAVPAIEEKYIGLFGKFWLLN